jgi:hypothetical protein
MEGSTTSMRRVVWWVFCRSTLAFAIGVTVGVFLPRYPPKENTPMALDESALSELLAALRAGDGSI